MAINDFTKVSQLFDLFREIQVDLPIGAARVFMAVVMDEGAYQNDVADRIGMPKATCSRNMRLLSPRLGPGKDGHGLVEFRVSAIDARFKNVYLTDTGRALKTRIMEILCK